MTSRKCQFGGAKVKLGDVLIQTFSGEWGSEEGDHLTPVLRTSNFNDDGTFDYASPAWRCIPEKKVVSKRLYRGDIVLEKSGGTPKRPVGIMSYYDSDQLALCSNFNQVLRVNSELMHPKYAFFQLRWLKQHNAFERYTRKTTGLQNIQMKKFVNLMILCPEISIQQEVVEQLEAISRQIKNIEYISSRLETLVKSRFVEMFDPGKHGQCAIGDLLSGIVSGTNAGGNQRPLKDGEYGVLKISAVTKGVFDSSEYKVVDDVSMIKMIHLRKGDLLFSRANTAEMVGATAIVDQDYGDLFLPDKLWRLDPKPGIDAVFLKALLSSDRLRAEMTKVATGTSGSMKNISMAKFRELPAFMPSAELQRDFVAFVSHIDKLRVLIQQQKEKLQMLYDSLAQEYFAV